MSSPRIVLENHVPRSIPLYVAQMPAMSERAAAGLSGRPTRGDLLVGVCVTAAILAETIGSDIPGPRWVLVVCAVGQGAALIWRRVLPWAVPAIESVFLAIPIAVGTPSDDSSTFGLVALVVAVFAMGRYGLARREDRIWSLTGWAVALGIAWGSSVIGSGFRVSDMIFIALFAVAPVIFGRAISVSQSAQREAEILNERLVEQSEQLREQAVQDERERIARELHDVIAHSVSLMGLQAGAARRVLPDGNEEVVENLRSIEETGRDTLNELRRLLGVMRSSDSADDLAPQPGLGSLPALVERQRASGASIQLELDERLFGLSPGVDLAAFRIVQEALTNSRRHAPDSAVRIRIAARGNMIELDVHSDDAPRNGTADSAAGHGIVGMKERAALYGGSVEADFVDGDGFVVHAMLPAEFLHSQQATTHV
jgi:signal transduction histidine kinase